jgi:hypothetical protein
VSALRIATASIALDLALFEPFTVQSASIDLSGKDGQVG